MVLSRLALRTVLQSDLYSNSDSGVPRHGLLYGPLAQIRADSGLVPVYSSACLTASLIVSVSYAEIAKQMQASGAPTDSSI